MTFQILLIKLQLISNKKYTPIAFKVWPNILKITIFKLIRTSVILTIVMYVDNKTDHFTLNLFLSDNLYLLFWHVFHVFIFYSCNYPSEVAILTPIVKNQGGSHDSDIFCLNGSLPANSNFFLFCWCMFYLVWFSLTGK